jgi:hypothetical protein
MPSRTIAMDAPHVLSASHAIASAGVPRRVVDATRASACGGVNIETTWKPAVVSDPSRSWCGEPSRPSLEESDARGASSARRRRSRDRPPATRRHHSGGRRRPRHWTSATNEHLRKEVSRGQSRCPLRWPCLPAHPVAVRASVTAGPNPSLHPRSGRLGKLCAATILLSGGSLLFLVLGLQSRDDGRIRQGRGISQRFSLGNIAQQAAHDLS